MKFFILLIFLLGFVSSFELSCPKEVVINEDFECSIFLENNKLSYDVKIVLKGGDKIVNKIWSGSSFTRADWYAEKLINQEKTLVRLIIEKEFYGNLDGEIKIREFSSKKVIHSESFKIQVIKPEENISKEEMSFPQENEIFLNSKDIKTEKNTDLLDLTILKYSGLICLGLIAMVLYLIKEKNKNVRRNYKEDTFGINN